MKMHIPVFSASAASKRWCGGRPELMTHKSLVQAQHDAPYWTEELRAGNMPAFDVHSKHGKAEKEAYHLERFRLLSYIHNEGFWIALVDHLTPQPIAFWLPALASAIESGNVHALSALNAKYSLQTLFFEWFEFMKSSQMKDVVHPKALQWFARDNNLHDLLRAFSENTFNADYAELMLSNALWWDAANDPRGAQSVSSLAKEWCALPLSLRTTAGAVKNTISMLTCLNRRDMDRQNKDPQRIYRNAPASQELATALEGGVALICKTTNLPLALIRTLTGRMTPEDLENPLLCAVVQYQDPYDEADWFCIQQHRVPLRSAQYQQVVHNARRAGPLSTLLEMQCSKGMSWEIYNVAESFINQRPVNTMALPDGLLETSLSGLP